MRLSPTHLNLVLLATSLTAAGLAWKWRRDLSALQQQVETASHQTAKALVPHKPVDAKATTVDATQAAPSISPDATDQVAVNKAAATETNKIKATPPAAAIEDQASQSLATAQRRNRVENTYAALFNTLSLNPEQLERFKQLLVDKRSAVSDVVAVGGNDLNVANYADAFMGARANVNNEIKTLLGDDGYAKYQNYEQTFPARNAINQVQNSLVRRGEEPLSSAQREKLVDILMQNPLPAEDRTKGFSGISPAASQAAANVLSPAQHETMERVRLLQQRQREMSKLVRKATNGAGVPVAPGK